MEKGPWEGLFWLIILKNSGSAVVREGYHNALNPAHIELAAQEMNNS
jgi:hypothetical protein